MWPKDKAMIVLLLNYKQKASLETAFKIPVVSITKRQSIFRSDIKVSEQTRTVRLKSKPTNSALTIHAAHCQSNGSGVCKDNLLIKYWTNMQNKPVLSDNTTVTSFSGVWAKPYSCYDHLKLLNIHKVLFYSMSLWKAR